MQEEDLAVIKIKVCLVAVKTDLGSSSTKMVIGVVILITSAIKIMEELVIFIGYKASELEVFRITVTVTITITGRVGKGVEIIRQQR